MTTQPASGRGTTCSGAALVTASAVGDYFGCFAADTPAWRVTPGTGHVVEVQMSELRSGDRVLSMGASGRVFIDTVVRNLHVHDTRTYAMLVLHHAHGSLTITADHAVFVDGEFMAASSARIGGKMAARGEHAHGLPEEVTITAITHTTGRIINPITSSGTILAGPAGGAVRVGSVPYFAGNAAVRFVALPGPWKMVAALMPDAFQDSLLLEVAFTHPMTVGLASLGSAGLPFATVVALFFMYNAIVCALFLVGNAQLMGAVAALALGTAAAKAAMPRRAKAGHAAVRT
ncbi:hypothetical protein FOA52_004397 [Chlamydomonas sp. UWO 241]|nr:hypothetical protein FOA52_004397 [Chlamydomonas sp. UWO 241]